MLKIVHNEGRTMYYDAFYSTLNKINIKHHVKLADTKYLIQQNGNRPTNSIQL